MEGVTPFVERMGDLGVIAEAEDYYDALDRGESPCGEGDDVNDVIEEARKIW